MEEGVAGPLVLDGSVCDISFGLSSSEEICTSCANDISITLPSQLTNPFLGLPLESGKCEACGTSEHGQCEGHFGYIQLPIPIYHPCHVPELKHILNLVCLKCLRMKKAKALNILKKIPVDTRKKLESKGCHPQNGFIMQCLPVPPNCLYSLDYTDGKSIMSSDISLSLLKRVLNKIDNIQTSRTGPPNFMAQMVESNDLQAAISLYMHLRGTPKAPHDIMRKFVRVEGSAVSTKQWLEKMRTLFIRKSSGFSSRSVITGDTYKGVNEIGLPLEIAMKVTVEEKVTAHNMERLQEIVDNGQCVTYRDGLFTYAIGVGSKGHTSLKVGQVIHRSIMDGDVVFVNRPPSTHKHSLQAFSVYVHGDVVFVNRPPSSFLNITGFRDFPLGDMPMLQVLRYTSENVFVPLTVGGGIRDFTDGNGRHYSSLEVAAEYFRSGADKVSIGSDAVYAAEAYLKTGVKTGKSSLEQISRVYGNQAVVVSIDTRRVYVKNPEDVEFKIVKMSTPGPHGEEYAWYQCTVNGGRDGRHIGAYELAKSVEELGAGEILLNCIDCDGQGNGFDIDLVKLISDAVTIPVIASSGAGAVEHFSDVFRRTNASAALAAGIFHRKEVPIQSVKEHLLREAIEVRL